MAWWITIYCRKSVANVSAAQLLAGIRDRDPEASAGVDYLTLAEDYEVAEELVKPALDALRVEAQSAEPLDFEVAYREPGLRPIVVHHWAEPERVKEELEEAKDVRSVPRSLAKRLAETKEIVALELGFPMLEDMGVVFAYEIARYLAQKGDGLIVDDDDRWQRIKGGAFVPA